MVTLKRNAPGRYPGRYGTGRQTGRTPKAYRGALYSSSRLKAGGIREAARGRWLSILPSLVPALAPAVERWPRHGPCPVHGGRDGFRLFEDAPDCGGGICNTCGPRPDGFAVLRWLTGWDFPTTLAAVADVLGLDGGARPASGPLPPSTPTDTGRKLARMRATWDGSRPLVGVRAAVDYLEARGVLPSAPERLEDLRAHPKLQHTDTQGRRTWWPALVALVRNADKRPVGLHVTWIDPTNPGKKAPVAPPRRLYAVAPGATRGAAVRLYTPAEELAVAEGIETALAAHLLTGWPVWAALSAGGLERLVLPSTVRVLTVCADHDQNGTGQRAAERLADRLVTEGRVVRIAVPPKPGDWLDVLQAERREVAR